MGHLRLYYIIIYLYIILYVPKMGKIKSPRNRTLKNKYIIYYIILYITILYIYILISIYLLLYIISLITIILCVLILGKIFPLVGLFFPAAGNSHWWEKSLDKLKMVCYTHNTKL